MSADASSAAASAAAAAAAAFETAAASGSGHGAPTLFPAAAAGAGGVPGCTGEKLLDTIARLRADQLRIKQERTALSKALKNACKKKNRLKVKARQLTDGDLVEVLQMRATMRASASAAAATEGGASSSEHGGEPAATTE